LPAAEPLPKNKKEAYLEFVKPLQEEIDRVPFKELEADVL
jgi:hypothetical protein